MSPQVRRRTLSKMHTNKVQLIIIVQLEYIPTQLALHISSINRIGALTDRDDRRVPDGWVDSPVVCVCGSEDGMETHCQ